MKPVLINLVYDPENGELTANFSRMGGGDVLLADVLEALGRLLVQMAAAQRQTLKEPKTAEAA